MYNFDKHGSRASNESELSSDNQDELFRAQVESLWQNEYFVDVTLVCEERLIAAHKLVLSSYSDYFKKLLISFSQMKQKHNQHPIILMPEIPYDVLKAIVDFMYCGQVNVAEHNVSTFIKFASILKIKGLDIGNSQTDEFVGEESSLIEEAINDCDISSYNSTEGVRNNTNEKVNNRGNVDVESSLKFNQAQKRSLQVKRRSYQESANFNRASKRITPDVCADIDYNNEHYSDEDYSADICSALNRPKKARSSGKGHMPIERKKSTLLSVERQKAGGASVAKSNYSKGSNLSDIDHRRHGSPGSLSVSTSYPNYGVSHDVPLYQNLSDESLLNWENLKSKLGEFLRYFSKISLSITNDQLKMLAIGVDSVLGYDLFTKSGLYDSWLEEFKSSNAHFNCVIKDVDYCQLEHTRQEITSIESLYKFLIPYHEILDAFRMHEKPLSIWSVSQYTIRKSGCKTNLLASRGRFIPALSKNFEGNGESVSFLVGASAQGDKTVPFIVYSEELPEVEKQNFKSPLLVNSHCSTSGYVDSDLLLKWFKKVFLPECPYRSGKKPLILLMDSLFPLVSDEMMNLAYREDIILFSLMPHLHQACQPLDLPIFKVFSKIVQNSLANVRENDCFKLAVNNVISDFYANSISDVRIREGFKCCSLFPLSCEIDVSDYSRLLSECNLCDPPRPSKCLAGQKHSAGGKSKLHSPRVPLANRGSFSRKKKQWSSDEDEICEEGMEDMMNCYVCGSEFQILGDERLSFRCTRPGCFNKACINCLPANFEDDCDYICIDCN